MKEISDEELLNSVLANQIPEAPNHSEVVEEVSEAVESVPDTIESKVPSNPLAGKKLSFIPGDRSSFISDEDKEASRKFDEMAHVSRTGENIFQNAELREGWIPVNRELMGTRSYFYPQDWEFRIRPATVEAIRNWSNVDENNIIGMDDVFNEILKSCVSIVTPQGQIPWGNINSWDRFYFLLLIREYTFVRGEHKLNYEEDCPECDNPVQFELTANSLLYEFPDEEIIKYYDIDNRCWMIDPEEYEVNADPIKLYLPTLEKDANIKKWLIDRVQNNPNKKTDQAFLRFLPWLSPKISKDLDISKKQIKDLEFKFKSCDMDLFTFMDEVLRNIIVQLKDKLVAKCPVCGEEVTAQIRFPNNVSDLFNISNKHRKFGSK